MELKPRSLNATKKKKAIKNASLIAKKAQSKLKKEPNTGEIPYESSETQKDQKSLNYLPKRKRVKSKQ